MIFAHKSLEILVEEVFASGKGDVKGGAGLLGRNGVSDANIRHSAFTCDQSLQVRVVEDSVQRQRLVWLRHTLHVQHDDVLDETEDLVPALVGLHDRHEVLDFVEDRLAEAVDDVLRVVPHLLRANLLSQLAKEAVR